MATKVMYFKLTSYNNIATRNLYKTGLFLFKYSFAICYSEFPGLFFCIFRMEHFCNRIPWLVVDLFYMYLKFNILSITLIILYRSTHVI